MQLRCPTHHELFEARTQTTALPGHNPDCPRCAPPEALPEIQAALPVVETPDTMPGKKVKGPKAVTPRQKKR